MPIKFVEDGRKLTIQMPSRWTGKEILYFTCYWFLFAFVAVGWVVVWYLEFVYEAEPPNSVPHLPAIFLFCAWLVWLIISPLWLSSLFWPVVGRSTLEIGEEELFHLWTTPLFKRQRTYPLSNITELRPYYYRTLRYSAIEWYYVYVRSSWKLDDFRCERATIRFVCEDKTYILPMELDGQEAKLVVKRVASHCSELTV